MAFHIAILGLQYLTTVNNITSSNMGIRKIFYATTIDETHTSGSELNYSSHAMCHEKLLFDGDAWCDINAEFHKTKSAENIMQTGLGLSRCNRVTKPWHHDNCFLSRQNRACFPPSLFHLHLLPPPPPPPLCLSA